MSGKMIYGLVISLSGVLFSCFWLFWASSGKSETFNGIMEEIARSKRKFYKDYSVEDIKVFWRIAGFILLVGFTFALITTIVNKGEIVHIRIK